MQLAKATHEFVSKAQRNLSQLLRQWFLEAVITDKLLLCFQPPDLSANSELVAKRARQARAPHHSARETIP